MELLDLYDATKKMLPDEYLQSVTSGSEEVAPISKTVRKRTVEFMGMHVSYPQYVRLRAIQREVIKMDQMIRRMVRSK